ncbi:MAG: NusB antitermination factor [Firmicutes bacterium]|nr:NusB antitermination factor [Bacillota bacterium]
MSRRKAREMALQTLFQLDFNQMEQDAAMQAVFAENVTVSKSAKEYAELLVKGTRDHLAEIDEIISEAAIGWKLDRMAGVDRNITRMAIFEMRFAEETLAPNVIINEAVELAKLFGSAETGRFINGILGSLVKKTRK